MKITHFLATAVVAVASISPAFSQVIMVAPPVPPPVLPQLPVTGFHPQIWEPNRPAPYYYTPQEQDQWWASVIARGRSFVPPGGNQNDWLFAEVDDWIRRGKPFDAFGSALATENPESYAFCMKYR